MMFLHAINVHQGGGKSLLNSLLEGLPSDIKFVVQLDQRMQIPSNLPDNVLVKFVKPTILGRLFAEWWLSQKTRPNDVVLCFGNLPPLFRLAGSVHVFVQNRYLIDGVCLRNFPLKVRIRLLIERLWFSSKISRVNSFIVQTPSMKKLLEAQTNGLSVHVRPFIADNETYKRSVIKSKINEGEMIIFAYIASGEPHKNHKTLVAAWHLLAEEGFYPVLKLTVDRLSFPNLSDWIDQQINAHQLKIFNEGHLSHKKVMQLYGCIDAMIYPSTFESFGLPLIEARQMGLPILASELDYVRDVIDPEETFDPNSAVSIARAVKRFMLINEVPLPLSSPRDFLGSILNRTI
jgi:glycosyltransferase involved in cell wall biosynthesis